MLDAGVPYLTFLSTFEGRLYPAGKGQKAGAPIMGTIELMNQSERTAFVVPQGVQMRWYRNIPVRMNGVIRIRKTTQPEEYSCIDYHVRCADYRVFQ